jgi:F420-dependent oxidoreductase-like protein
VRLALMIEGQEGVTWEQWLALADACERSGVDSLFRSDHYLGIHSGETGSLDAWTLIAALAARTTTLRLGTLVSPVTFRHPSVLARAVVTADHVSGGRVELGMGAGWMEREHEAMGFPFPETRVRLELLAEQVEIVHRELTEDRFDFEGRHYTLKNAVALPKPVQQPRPPIIVGGRAHPGTANVAARFADEYNTLMVGPEEFAVRAVRLREACERVDRDPSTMRLSLMTGCILGRDREDLLERARRLYGSRPEEEDFDAWLADCADGGLVGTVDEVAEQLRALEEAGCERVMLQHLLHDDLEMVELIGRELAPLLA